MNDKKNRGVGLIYGLLVFVIIIFVGVIGGVVFTLNFGLDSWNITTANAGVSQETSTTVPQTTVLETESTTQEETTVPSTEETTEETTECVTTETAYEEAETVVIHTISPTTEAATTTQEEPPRYIDIVAAGDNLVHLSYYNSYYDAATDTYNFNDVFSYIKTYIQSADLAIINQEVPCAGEGTPVAGYPAFNAPHEALDVMAEIGFDVFTTATNHCLDKGYRGLVNTLDYLHTTYPDVLTTGTYSSYEDSITTPIIEVDGVKIAVLDYTYGTNGVPVTYDYSVNLLGNLDKMTADITRARQEADFVIVCAHWGREYYTGVIQEQRDYAETIAECGADLIIGTHPHVVEPMEYIETSDGREVPVFYSLGNFIAFQNQFPRPVGGLAKITLKVTSEGVTIDEAYLDFTFVSAVNYEANKYDFRVFMVSDLPERLVSAYTFSSRPFSYRDILDFCKEMNPDWTK